MKDLDISKIPARFVRLWWLSKIKNYRHLIISEAQIPIFSVNYIAENQPWDLYRDHWIYVKSEDKLMSMREYNRSKQPSLLSSRLLYPRPGEHPYGKAGFTKLKYTHPK